MAFCFAGNKMRVKGTERSERGAALVEAALTMLMLFVLVFGVFEAGRILNIQQTLTNAAREGARLSVLPLQGGTDTLAPPALVRSRVRTFLGASGLNGAAVPDGNILVNQSYNPGGSTVYSRVTVTVPYRVLSLSMFSFMEVNLQGQATMRNETNLQ
jgi:Flp pilus assembly protein TadG